MTTSRTQRAVARENPLVPDQVLRRLHRSMLRYRAMATTMTRAGERVEATDGACFAAVLASMKRRDLVSEAGPGLSVLLSPEADEKMGKAPVAVLPAMAEVTERLLMAVGAATALKAGGKGPVLVVMVEHGEMPTAAWKQMLGFVARLELPVLFVVMPRTATKVRVGELSAKSAGWGVPGFPVDADDATALYRVVQESMGRLRAGEGPVLLEGIRWRGDRGAMDAVTRIEEQMRARGMVVRGTAEG